MYVHLKFIDVFNLINLLANIIEKKKTIEIIIKKTLIYGLSKYV